MGKRYYCEYCERAFQDNISARKKHIISIAHIRKRDEWYWDFKDKKDILEENLNKKPCHKYLSTGTCPFGNQCKYRHLSESELMKLKNEIENVEKPLDLPSGDEIVQKWLASRKTKATTQEENVQQEQEVEDVDEIVPSELKLLEPLPPSLSLPPPGGWKFFCNDLASWG